MADTSCSWYDLGCHFSWLATEIKSFFVWAYDGVLSGLASLFEAIPVPDFLLNMGSFTLPPAIAWAAQPFEIPFGLGLIVTAYVARFILRRIPGIG